MIVTYRLGPGVRCLVVKWIGLRYSLPMSMIHKTLFKKNLALFFSLILILLTISACAMTKAKYEDTVKSVLADLGKELKKKGQDKQIAALDSAKSRLEDISAPDDFFVGHSDLVESIELLSKALQAADKPEKKGKKGVETNTEYFELLRAAQTDFAKAMRELPFLEYELRQSMGDLFQPAQNTPFRPPTGLPPTLQR